jgi:predicted nucleic acid-binding protein
MKKAVLVDTGFWIALFDRRDTNHLFAKNSLKLLLQDYRLYLSDFIVFETITYLNCSIKRHDLAIRFLGKVREPTLKTLVVDEGVKVQALESFQKYSDKNLSITDCTSFVLMLQEGIKLYAGFDDHFQQMGFVSFLAHMDQTA